MCQLSLSIYYCGMLTHSKCSVSKEGRESALAIKILNIACTKTTLRILRNMHVCTCTCITFMYVHVHTRGTALLIIIILPENTTPYYVYVHSVLEYFVYTYTIRKVLLMCDEH